MIKKQFFIAKWIVVNKKWEILLVKRERPLHKESHNNWELPWWKIDFWESPNISVIREIKEESWYDAKIEYMLWKIASEKMYFPNRESHMLIVSYVCKLVWWEKSFLDKDINDISWFNIKDINKLKTLSWTMEFINEYINWI